MTQVVNLRHNLAGGETLKAVLGNKPLVTERFMYLENTRLAGIGPIFDTIKLCG